MMANGHYVLAGCVCLSVACASDHTAASRASGTHAAGPETEPKDAEDALGIAFNPMYSAYDGDVHAFRVPVRVTGARGELEVTTSPADFVSAEPSEQGVILTTRRAGTAKVTITDRAGQRGSAQLIVTETHPEDVDIGMERYCNRLDGDYWLPSGTSPPFDAAVLSALPRNADGGFVFPEGGLRIFDAGVPRPTSRHIPSCLSCHTPEGSAPEDGMEIDGEYTPQQVAGLSDQELMRVFVDGEKPEGGRFRIVNGGGAASDESAARTFKSFHAYKMAEETARGVLAYMRRLRSKSRGELDFGGLYPDRTE